MPYLLPHAGVQGRDPRRPQSFLVNLFPSYGYQCRFGEIDLIAWDGDILCFVEVKTRTNLQMGLPREYVTPAKQRRIKKTALFYLAAHDLDCPARFDVAEVYAEKPGDKNGVRIEYLEDAFQ